ncbi:MAG TPA: aminoglycoside adenylyltransferase domain-containing protein [Solirubrobacterales bacterium]|nr:aminoglycoside adenylyltransferase domain-containing protein [Solirubrobacterales bacterium]
MQTRADADAESGYLANACERLRAILDPSLIGVYAGGSWALGDYLPGRSDLDVAVVVRESLSPELGKAAVARLRHESLPCPARCLELVVYRLDTARSGSAGADFELNLNTGGDTPLLVQSNGASRDAGAHWFAIDRSVLAQAGIALLGPPANEVFAPIPLAALAPVVAESVRWHRDHPVEPGDAVLNACRALRFADEGCWSSKPAAGRWAVGRGLAPPNLVTRACRARAEPVSLDPEEVAAFLGAVESRLRSA